MCASRWQQGLQQFDSVLPLSRLRFKSRSYSSSRINPTAIINSPLKRTFAISLGIDSKSGQGLQRFGFVLPTSLALANKEGKNKLEERLKDPNYWANLCNLQVDTGKYEEAKAACEEVIALRPKNPLAWANHSGVLLKMEKYPEAIASAEQALKFDKKTSLALTYKCIAFSALRRNEEALDACNQALKVDGNWGRKSPKLAWINRGAILSTLGQYEKAIIAFDRTLLLEGRDSLALAYRCQVYTKQKQFEAAVSDCSSAIAGNGDWGNKSKTFALFNRAQANRQLNKLEVAVADYDELLAIDPNDAIAWASQGMVLEKLAQ